MRLIFKELYNLLSSYPNKNDSITTIYITYIKCFNKNLIKSNYYNSIIDLTVNINIYNESSKYWKLSIAEMLSTNKREQFFTFYFYVTFFLVKITK